jgi:DHA2 family multidrug resistance protein
MNNASGLINLARNIGASTGISFVTTMLDRRAQFHQDVLSGNLQGTNPHFQGALHRITHALMLHEADSVHAAIQAHGLVYQELQRQAMMLSFVDNFRTMAIICVFVIPLMLVMKGRK